MKRHEPLTADQKAFLHEHYAKYGPNWVAMKLGVKVRKVQNYASYQKLTVPRRRGHGVDSGTGDVKKPLITQMKPREDLAVPCWPSIRKCKGMV